MSLLDRVMQAGGSSTTDLPSMLAQAIAELQQIDADLQALVQSLAPTPEAEQQVFGPFGGSTSPTSLSNAHGTGMSIRAVGGIFSSDTSFLSGLRVDGNILIPFHITSYAPVYLQFGPKGIYVGRGQRLSIAIDNATSAVVSGVIFGVPQLVENA